MNKHLLSTLKTALRLIPIFFFVFSAINATAQCSLTINIIGQSSCSGSTGAANAVVTGGTAPYTYLWSNGQTTQVATSLAPGTYTVNATSANGCTGTQTVTIQAVSVSPNAGPDVSICLGSSIQLNATGGSIYAWSPSTGLSNINIANPIATPTSTTTYTVTVGVPSGELVTNGNFSAGNTGFISQYGYVNTPYVPGQPTSGLYPEGVYAVVPNPSIYHSNFNFSPADHTTGTGNFMAVNGARPDQNITIVWRQIVNVIPNTVYTFSTWVTSIHPTAPANLNFSINGSTIGTNITAPTPGTWVQFYTTWNSGSNTTADIRIVDLTPDAGGNDFGLDDISFTTICNTNGSDQVIVTVSPVIATNTITCSSPSTGCSPLNPGNIVGSTPTGGNGTYAYQWQSSVDNVVWTNISGATSISYDPPAVTTTTYFQRIVTSGGCSSSSSVCTYVVGTDITNNTITAPSPQSFCGSGNPGNIVGSVPTGGGSSGSFTYQWQSSTDQITWTNITSGNGGTGQSYDPPSLSQTTYYRRIALRNNCSAETSSTVVITINPNPTPVITANSPLSLCSGATPPDNVTLSTAAQTGNVYLWSPGGATTSNIFVTTAGNYTVQVTNANGCVGTSAAAVVTVTSPPTLTCSSTNVLCKGALTGTASVSATGGATPYTYLWSNGGTTSTISNLPAGTYSVIVNQNGCSATCSRTITEPVTALSGSITAQTNILCFGNSTGSVTVQAAGGTANYKYKIDAGAYGTATAGSNTFSGLSAGSHTVTIQDANLCTITVPVTIATTAALSINNISQTNTICFGTNTGSVTVQGVGGTLNYQYKIDAGSYGTATEGSNTFGNLSPGAHTVTILDANNCSTTLVVTITAPASPLSASLVSTVNAACQNVCNGSATATATGGQSPYSYLWSNNATGASVNNLCAGTYSVIVTDSRGCKDTVDVLINLNPPAAISLTITNVYCNNDHTGTITINHLSGTGPYTYLWSNGQTTQTATGLSLGNYSVTVTDGNGCTVSATGEVRTYSNLAAFVTTTQANNGNNGTAVVSVFGGTAPYTYLWSNGQTTSSISGLATGSYSVTVTDADGYTTTELFNITNTNSIASGSFIVKMGNTMATGLKPYGLIYDLVHNNSVPVKWIIKPGKTVKDETDFTIGSDIFKSGAFVVEAQYRTSAVNAVIANWVSQGVVGITTTSNLSLPVFNTITTFSNVVVDTDNAALVTPYFANAGIPSSIYTLGLPSDLDACDDAYILPHADPTWATHSNLLTFNTTSKGFIWAGCHAVSVLEGIANPGNSNQRMNFLTNTGLKCYGAGSCGSLITESHANPLTPYTYQSSFHSDPIMQFLGDMTPSSENGSERMYIPLSSPGQWRSTTSRTITTADGTSPREGVKIAYGPGFGVNTNGMVMYEAGHSAVGKGTIENQVAFERAFFNFILNAGISKRIAITATIPQTFISGTPQNVSVSVTGGSPPYTYQWSTACGATIANATSASTTITFPSLPPASKCYVTCIVTDACNRTSFVSSPVASMDLPPPALFSLVSKTNVTCFGVCNGAIDISVSGAAPPYSYLWSSGQTTQDISGLCPGNYTITVTDANGCTKQTTYTITQPAAALSVAVASQTNVSCNTGSNGAASVTVSGGTTAYSYNWTPGNPTGDGTASVTGLTAGTWTCTVTDANGCTAAQSFTITQPAAALAVAVASQTNVSCNAGSNGAASVTVSGGTTAYSYNWTPGNPTGDGTASVTGLTAGTWTCTVTDANGCTAAQSFTITQPAAALSVAVASQTNVSCNTGSNGAASVTVSGGTTAYSYNWTPGNPTGDGTASVTGLTAGTWTCTVTDANGCTAARTFTITEPAAALTAALTSQVNVLCFGNATGSAVITPSGGTAPYSITPSQTGLAAGLHTFTVTDDNDCSTTIDVTILQPAAALTAALTSQVNVLCFGNATGSAVITPSGGTAPYSITPAQTGLTAGLHTFTVTDFNGCSTTIDVTILQPAAALTAALTSQVNVLCFGNATGSAVITPSGGTAPYSISPSQTGLAAGVYTFTITDANGCSITVDVTITEPAAPLLASSSAGSIACNEGTTSVTVSATGGTAPYSGTGTFTVSAGAYSYTVTDANGCTSVTSGSVDEPTTLVASSSTGSIACNEGTTSVTVSATGGTAPYSGTGTFTVSAGAYSYTVTDANGCTSTTTGSVDEPTTLVASSSAGSIACNEGTTSVTVSGTGGTAPYSGTGTFTVSAGAYSYTVTDANGCTSITSGQVDEPDALVASSSAGTIECNGGTTSVVVSATGGTAPYSGTGTFTVSAGNYSFTVTDANQCSSTTTGTITDLDLIPPTVACQNITAQLDANGTAIILAAQIDNGSSDNCGIDTMIVSPASFDCSNIGENSVTLTVTDINGNSASCSAAVTVVDNLAPTAICQSITVSLDEQGNASITAAQIDNGSSDNCGIDWMAVSPNTFTCANVGANTVVLTVMDINGNASTCSATVTIQDNIAPVAQCQNISVQLDENGNATIDASQINNGSSDNCGIDNITVTPSSFDCSTIGANTVTLTVTDLSGNTSTCSATVTVIGAPVDVSITADGATEFCDGEQVILTATSGASYLWSPNGETTQSITVLTAGSYSVNVTNQFGCNGASDLIDVIVHPNPVPTISADAALTFCENGSVTLTASSASAYLWSPNGETTQSITVTTSGDYSVSVNGLFGCRGTSLPVTVTVNDNPSPIVSASGSLIFCTGGSVTLTSNIETGNVWSPNGETTQSITVSSSGNYSVTVVDANGCVGTSAITDVTVSDDPTPIVTASGATVICGSGSVTLTSSSQTGNIWSPNGETTQSITVSSSGNYSVTVDNGNGCSGTSNITGVTIVPIPTPTIVADGPTTVCEGETIVLTSSSASGNVWSPNGETTQTISALASGSYSVSVTDNYGCIGVSAPIDVVISQNPVASVSASGSTTFCEGGSITLSSASATNNVWSPNGETTQSITVSTSGSYSVLVTNEFGCSSQSDSTVITVNPNPSPAVTADGPTTFCYGSNVILSSSSSTTYVWTPTAETSQSINVTLTGDYSVTVTDANGCSGSSEPVHVEVSEELLPPTVIANSPTSFCVGQSVMFTASSTGNVTYQWFNNGVAISNGVGAAYTAWVTGSYYVVATDANGCTVQSVPVQVNVSETPTANAGTDEMLCADNSITLTASGGTNYQWSNGETTQSITVSPSDTTQYVVIVSNPNCDVFASDTVNVNVVENPVAAVQASDSPSLGNPVNFTDISGDNSITNWFWNFGDGVSSTTQNTHHTYDTEGLFNVVLTVENQYGCTASDTVEVEIQQIILIPNVITPNGDGFNDGLGIKNNGVDNYEMVIYDRWGLIIFEDKSGDIYWDGKTVAGADASAGTYFYILNVNNHASLGDFQQNGFITLIR